MMTPNDLARIAPKSPERRDYEAWRAKMQAEFEREERLSKLPNVTESKAYRAAKAKAGLR